MFHIYWHSNAMSKHCISLSVLTLFLLIQNSLQLSFPQIEVVFYQFNVILV